MNGWQEQAEREMWDAAVSVTPSVREYRYDVIVSGTGARCLSTDSWDDAVTRADGVGGYVVSVPLATVVYEAGKGE